METEDKLEFNKILQKILIILFTVAVIIFFFFFKNTLFKSTLILRNLGNISLDPEIAFNNTKPTFLEFYAEWCEVCKEMAPKIDAIRKEYSDEVNFVFLNVDNTKWDKYVKNLNVNGIPQVNLFDENANLISTLIGLQEEDLIENALNKLLKKEMTHEDFISSHISDITNSRIVNIGPRTHG